MPHMSPCLSQPSTLPSGFGAQRRGGKKHLSGQPSGDQCHVWVMFLTWFLASILILPGSSLAHCPGIAGSCFVDASQGLVTTSQTGPSAVTGERLVSNCSFVVYSDLDAAWKCLFVRVLPHGSCLCCTVRIHQDARGHSSYKFPARWIWSRPAPGLF